MTTAAKRQNKKNWTIIAVAISFHTLLGVLNHSNKTSGERADSSVHRAQLLKHAKWFKHCLAVNAFGRRAAVGIFCVLYFFVCFVRIVVHQYYQTQWVPESERERGCATRLNLTKKFVYKFFLFWFNCFLKCWLCVCVHSILCSYMSEMRWKCKWLHKIDC